MGFTRRPSITPHQHLISNNRQKHFHPLRNHPGNKHLHPLLAQNRRHGAPVKKKLGYYAIDAALLRPKQKTVLINQANFFAFVLFYNFFINRAESTKQPSPQEEVPAYDWALERCT